MKVIIEFQTIGSAFDLDDPISGGFEQELRRVLRKAEGKLIEQLHREPATVCKAPESADTLMDINGNSIGSVKLYRADAGSRFIKVGIKPTAYYAPDVDGAVDLLKNMLAADMSNWSEWLVIEELPIEAGEEPEIIEYVWEQLSKECPHADDDGHDGDCTVCGGEETYIPGWEE